MKVEQTVGIMIEGLAQSGPVRAFVLELGRKRLAESCADFLIKAGCTEDMPILEIAQAVDNFCRGIVNDYPKKAEGA